MSKTTYGYIAFKLNHPDGMTDKQFVRATQMTIKTLKLTVEQEDGELCTLQEVIDRSLSDGVRIGTQSVADAAAGKPLEVPDER